jgi:peptidoglycan-N-acetylmuramic acid deacetylase
MKRIIALWLCVAVMGMLAVTGEPMLAAPTIDEQPYHFGFKKSKRGELPSIAQEGFMHLIERQGGIFLGDTKKKELFLTFDNGYENGYTSKVLDVLKAKKVPATFFVTGHFVKDQPALMRRMASEGHIIGNHSWSHPDMSTISSAEIRSELDRVLKASAELTGQKEMKYVRPPRGIFSEKALASCREAGYTSVFWSVAYKDWDPNIQQGTDYAYRQVMSQLHPGAVILLHSVSKDNAEALGSIIDDARKQGYEFKSLNDLKVKHYH